MAKIASAPVLRAAVLVAVTLLTTTAAGKKRAIEPRLTGFTEWQACRELLLPGRLVKMAVCPPSHIPSAAVSISTEECRDMTATQTGTLEALAVHPECTDEAVRKLDELARTATGDRAEVWSDLAAAYYVRAQRLNQPLDVLRSLGAAERATSMSPTLASARFNQALAQEALGLSAAVTSWDELQRDEKSPWPAEARRHWRRLDRQIARQAALQWLLSRERIPAAANRGDEPAVVRLTSTHRAAAQRLVEDELLPQWAAAPDAAEGAEPLQTAHAVARAIFKVSGDRYLLDAVTLIERNRNTAVGEILREGHAAFGEAREAERALGNARALAAYERSERAFERAGSVMRLSARLGRAIALTRTFSRDDFIRATALIEEAERTAGKQGYLNVRGRAESNHGFILFLANRYVESLAQYDRALATFRRAGDGENTANVHVREIGLYRTLNQNDLAWRHFFLAGRYKPYVVEPGSRHHMLGEMAAACLASGYPRIALLYQNDAIRLIEDELAAASPADKGSIEGLRTNLAIALRARAGIWLRYEPHEQYDAARRDLLESIRLFSRNPEADANVHRALLARVDEMEGVAASCSDPEKAVRAFTRALAISSPDEYRTFRAALYVERAESLRCAGRTEEAKLDLRAAIDELHREETTILEHRQRGQGESLWSGYFSRFQKSYDQLIRLFAEGDDPDDADQAFSYAEEARAFEPLNLLLDSKGAPEAFRKLTRGATVLSRSRVQEHLPPGTFLIEFCVLGDQTIVWIVSHDRFELLKEPVGRAAIAQWNDTIHSAAASRNVSRFNAALEAPFAALLSAPLSRIQSMPQGLSANRRLVFVPDGAIHGLPLAALSDPATKRHLIEDYPVAVAASATFYIFSRIRDEELSATTEAPSILLVGDPAFRNEPGFPPGLTRLREARREVERIGKLYGGQATLLPDKEATVPAFLELARQSTIVHFAGHAVINDASPFRSMLVLAPSRHRSGALDSEELLTELDLRKTRLFVLSACSSASGAAMGAEGLAPLLRPIIASGVPGVIGSLWDVGSAPTEELLVEFHRHYRHGADADRALQLAQLALMKRKEAGLHSVLAWAAFEVIGSTSSPFPPQAH